MDVQLFVGQSYVCFNVQEASLSEVWAFVDRNIQKCKFISVLFVCEFDRGVDFVDVCDECV